MASSDLRQLHQEFEEDSVDFKRYFSMFLYNWYWFAIGLFISFSIAYAINRYSEKLFTVSSTLLIRVDLFGGGSTISEAVIPGSPFFNNKQILNNEIGILKSYTLNKRVIDSLAEFHVEYVGVGRRNIAERRLYKDSPFLVVPSEGVAQPSYKVYIRILSAEKCRIEIDGNKESLEEVRFGDLYEKADYSFRVNIKDPDGFIYSNDHSNKYYFRFISTEAIANYYRGKLDISPIEKDASLVNLYVSGFVAAQEADYLNMLMKLYIAQGLEYKNQTADSTISFIDDQIELISKTLGLAENELEEFRRSKQLVDLSTEGGLLKNKLEKAENEKTELELQKKYYEYLSSYLDSRNESGDIVSPIIMGVEDQQLIRLVQELSQLQQRKKSLALNLRYDSSPLLLIENEINNNKLTLTENVREALSYLSVPMEEINGRIKNIEREIAKLPSTEREMIEIQRKFEISNTIYTFLLEKRAEIGIAKASNVSDNRIIDYSNLYNVRLLTPKPKQNYLFALLFGFLIPAFLIYILDYLNNRIIDKADIERGTGVPVLGYVSHNDYKSEIPVYDKPGSTLAESFRLIRTNLKFFIKGSEHHVIAVSSTISAEGKTFISINLATILAMLGKKVLLVGLDLRKPRIHKVLGGENGSGLSTYLIGSNEYKDVIQPTEVENLYYAPAGPVPPNPAELIERERMKEFIENAKLEFDYVIIDTPPIAIVTDALQIASYVDLYLLVVRQRYTSRNTLSLIQDIYNQGILKNVGIVINDISLSGYYGYGLRYGYSLGYGYNYGYNYYGKYTSEMYGDRKGKETYYTSD